jgi:hypothetical protein
LALGVLVMTFSLPLAAYAERFIERPGENIGRRALRRFNITQLLEQTDAALAPRAIRQMRRSAS